MNPPATRRRAGPAGRVAALAGLAAALAGTAGCRDDGSEVEEVPPVLPPYTGPGAEQRERARGEEVFRTGRDLGGDPENAYVCADCHNRNAADIAEDGQRLKAGHSLYGVSRRDTWLDGAATELTDGVGWCVSTFMGGEPPFPEGDEVDSLLAYLVSISREGDFPPLDWLSTPFTDLDLVPGDPVRGEGLFGRACAACHGEAGDGTDLGPRLDAAAHDDLTLANIVRTGSGRMPFFGADRLGDPDVFDLVAFLRAL